MQFGEWEFTCDRSATVAAYSRATAGGTDTCTCDGCRNFVLDRDRVYPHSFVSFLESLGVDPHKDGEAYHTGEISPGDHHYRGPGERAQSQKSSLTNGVRLGLSCAS